MTKTFFIYLKYIIIIFFLFWFPISILVYFKLYEAIILYTLFITIIIAIIRPYLLVFLYIYFLPMPSIISSQYNIFGYIGINEIAQVSVLLFFLINKFNLQYLLNIHIRLSTLK